jgi:hypothetical protein
MGINNVLLVLFFFFAPLILCSQDSLRKGGKRYRHAIGFGAGYTTGSGLLYRYGGARLAAQASFSFYNDPGTLRYKGGLTFLYNIASREPFRFFLYQANGYSYHHEVVYFTAEGEESFEKTPYKEKRKQQSFFNNSLGIGAGIMFVKRLGLDLMLGYGAYENGARTGISLESAMYLRF